MSCRKKNYGRNGFCDALARALKYPAQVGVAADAADAVLADAVLADAVLPRGSGSVCVERA